MLKKSFKENIFMSKIMYPILLTFLLVLLSFTTISSHTTSKTSFSKSVNLCDIEYDDNGYPITLGL